MRVLQVCRVQTWGLPANRLFVLSLAAAVSLTTGCKKETGAPTPAVTPTPAPGSALGTTQTAAALQLYAEMPKNVVSHVVGNARVAFALVKEADSLWPTPEEKGLAYYHSTLLLARAGRADHLTSEPAFVGVMQGILLGEYRSRLFRRTAADRSVSEKEVEDYYKAHRNQYAVKGQFSTRHIFLNLVDNPGKEKEKQALAEKALDEIKAGRPFQEVAKQYSDAEMEKGDVIGPLPFGDINPDLEKAIVALQPGQNTGVLKSKWGYNIFRLEQIERPTTKTLEMAHDSIVQLLRAQKQQAAYEQFDTGLEQQYPVTKRYPLLDDPKITSDSLVVESSFFNVSIADYHKRIAALSPSHRESLSDPENRKNLLDSWVAARRLEHAAVAAGIDRDPELVAMKDYMTSWTLSMLLLDRSGARVTSPSEEEIRKFYDANRSRFVSKPAEVRVRELSIVYRMPEGTSRRDYYLARKNAQERIEQVQAKLKQGADFAALVKEYSNSESAKKDGDLGFMPPEQWGPELAAAVAKINIGECTPVIETREAFNMFRLEERKPEEFYPLDGQRKEYIAEALRSERQKAVSARVRMKLAQVYRKDTSLEEIRRIAQEQVK